MAAANGLNYKKIGRPFLNANPVIRGTYDVSVDLAGIGDGAKPLIFMKGHSDTIRSVAAFKLGEKGDEKVRLVTGSYDHSIRVWDCDGLKDEMSGYDDDDRDRCLSIMDHGGPVESLIVVEPSATSTFKTSTAKSVSSESASSAVTR